MMPYEFLDDVAIADVEFRAWGEDLPKVFTAAAEATLNVMVHDLNTVEPREQRSIVLENEALDMLLFDLLQELIYYKDAENLLLRISDIDIEEESGLYRLRANATGEPLDPIRHEQGVDVKAVTLHRFSLEKTENGWQAYTILDI
jgi:SHS2 domain-containing protein